MKSFSLTIISRVKTPRKGNGLCAPLDWGFIAPTDNFLAEFEANDPRSLYTVNVASTVKAVPKAVYKLLGAFDSLTVTV